MPVRGGLGRGRWTSYGFLADLGREEGREIYFSGRSETGRVPRSHAQSWAKTIFPRPSEKINDETMFDQQAMSQTRLLVLLPNEERVKRIETI